MTRRRHPERRRSIVRVMARCLVLVLVASGARSTSAAVSTTSSPAAAAEPERDREPATGVVDADACIDENIKADLFEKRKRRDVRDRIFQQTNRHELTATGGYYASDLFESTWVVGASYAYHMTEDFAVETAASWTRLGSGGAPELERMFSLLGDKSRRSLMFDADLVWDPAHGKLRLGGALVHFDLYFAAGAGVIDSVLSNDIAANAGLGLKFFLGRAMAVRTEVRDHAYRQQLLGGKEWVNDVTTTLGIGIFLPVTP